MELNKFTKYLLKICEAVLIFYKLTFGGKVIEVNRENNNNKTNSKINKGVSDIHKCFKETTTVYVIPRVTWVCILDL